MSELKKNEKEPKPVGVVIRGTTFGPAEFTPVVVPGEPEKEEPKLPWYKKHQIKRTAGALLMVAGGIMTFYPPALILGQGLALIGGLLTGVGVAHYEIKKDREEDMSDSILTLVLEFIARIVALLKQRRHK